MDVKKIAFISLMGALANVLFAISLQFGPITHGVALDLSLLTVFVAALYGGPTLGFITGLFAGIFPGIYFGPMGTSSWLGLIGLPTGKALTGLASGLIFKGLGVQKRVRKSVLTVPLTLVSYIPEFIYTIAYFIVLMPYFIGGGGASILVFVLPKAWAEVIFMSFFMAALVGNNGFSNFINTFFMGHKTGSKS